MCKVHRATGSENNIVEDPGKKELTDPGYFTNTICHYCKDTGHLRNYCLKLAQKQNRKMCKYPGYTMKVGHTSDKCWKDPNKEKDRPANWVSRIKKNPNEASSVEIFP